MVVCCVYMSINDYLLLLRFYWFVCVDISKVQDDVVGDGTTSVVVLAAELLRVSNYVININVYSDLIMKQV